MAMEVFLWYEGYMKGLPPVIPNTASFEPGHEKTCLIPYANNKGADNATITTIVVFDAVSNAQGLESRGREFKSCWLFFWTLVETYCDTKSEFLKQINCKVLLYFPHDLAV